MSLPAATRSLLDARRTAVARGELSRMYPGAALDVITLWWFRGLVAPLSRLVRGPGPDERYHSPTGGCPLCSSAPPVEHTPADEGEQNR